MKLTESSSNIETKAKNVRTYKIILLTGGMRGGQLRPLKQSNLKEEYDAYVIDFTPIKQRGHLKNVK